MNRWDSGHFTYIAIHGFDVAWRTAFFPLFPLLEGIPSLLIKHLDPFITGLIVSNLADLVILIVLYRLVQEDFDRNQAYRTVLYLSDVSHRLFLCRSVYRIGLPLPYSA